MASPVPFPRQSTPLSRDAPPHGLGALVAACGTAAQPWPVPTHWQSGRRAPRDFADGVHHLAALFALPPTMADTALMEWAGPDDEAMRRWLAAAAAGLSQERALLARLSGAVGPAPPTPGQAATLAARAAHRHAMHALAASQRMGCAVGALAAMLIDWPDVRRLLATGAMALDQPIDLPLSTLPTPAETEALTDRLGEVPAIARAMRFGADQYCLHLAAMWRLLQRRASARG